MSAPRRCSECGGLYGHSNGCPETPEDDDDESQAPDPEPDEPEPSDYDGPDDFVRRF